MVELDYNIAYQLLDTFKAILYVACKDTKSGYEYVEREINLLEDVLMEVRDD